MRLVALALLLAACGSSDITGPCAAPTGKARATFTERTGGAVVEYDHGGSPINGYFELYEYDADGTITCESTYDLGFGG